MLVLILSWSSCGRLFVNKLVLYLEASGLAADLFANHHEVIAILEEECGGIPRALEFSLWKRLKWFDLETLKVDQYDAGRLDSAVFGEWLICLIFDPLYVVLGTR